MKKIKAFCLVFCLLLTSVSSLLAQNIDSLQTDLSKAKEDTNKVNVLLAICSQHGRIDDSTKKTYSEIALRLSEKLNYQKGKIFALISLAVYSNNRGRFDKSLEYLNEAFNVSKKIANNKLMVAEIYNSMGGAYYYKGDYSIALPYYLKSLALFEELRNKDKSASIEYNISLIYYQNKEYDKAVEYTTKANSLYKQINDSVLISLTISQLGMIAIEKANFELAIKYFKQSLEFTEKLKDKSYSLVNLIGLGNVLGDTKRYSEAIFYYKKALEIAKELNDERNIAICLTNIGHNYAYIGKSVEGIAFLKQAIDLSIKIGEKRVTTDAYFMLSEVFEMQNNFKKALKYSKLYIDLNDSIFSKENTEQINSLSAKYENEKKEKEIAQLNLHILTKEKDKEILNAKVKEKNTLIIVTIIGTFLLTILGLLFFSRQQLKFKKDKIIFEKQEALLQAEKQKTEDELLHAKKLLVNYTENLIDKNRAIEELQYENEKLKGLKTAELYKEKIDNLDDLNNATILTNEDWEKFKELFEQVYKGFFTRLKDKLPNLTNAETRLISLIKLNLDTKQMASMLGVSPNTIKVTKYRLRKKIELPENEDIDSLVESI